MIIDVDDVIIHAYLFNGIKCMYLFKDVDHIFFKYFNLRLNGRVT